MRNMKTTLRYLLILLSILSSIPLRAVDPTEIPFRIVDFLQAERARHQEKLWLHLDKPYYGAGDKIWFKAYLVDATEHRTDTLSNFIYVDIVDRKGKTVLAKKIKRDSCGFANNFEIPHVFPAGDYTLRAYTGWMTNFDPAFFFQRNIRIGNSLSGHVNAAVTYTDPKNGPPRPSCDSPARTTNPIRT